MGSAGLHGIFPWSPAGKVARFARQQRTGGVLARKTMLNPSKSMLNIPANLAKKWFFLM